MSQFLDKDAVEIKNIATLFEDDLGLNPIEAGLFGVTQIFSAMIGGETTRGQAATGSSTLFAYSYNLSNGTYVITKDNAVLLLVDLNDWLNERIGLGIFSEEPFGVYENYSKEQKQKMLDSSNDSVLRLFMDQGHIWKTREANGETELYPEKLIFAEQSSQFTAPFVDQVAHMAEDDSLDVATSKLIGEITRENYNFNQFKRDVAQMFNDFIQASGRGESRMKLGFDEEYVEFYIGLNFGDDGFYTLSQALYSGDPKKVPLDALSVEEAQSFYHPNVLEFPTSIMNNQDGEIIPEIKEDLENFKELIDTDILDYKFRFQIDDGFSKNILGKDITNDQTTGYVVRWLKDWLNNTQSVAESVKGYVTSAYISFLVSMIKDYDSGRLSDTIGEHYQRALKNLNLLRALNYIMFEKIISAKKTFFDALSDATSETSQEGEIITPEEREKAYKSSLEAFKKGQGEDIPDDGPSEEDIENRQKYFKQCALMLNMPTLRDTYQQKLALQYSGKTPYHGRFVTLRSKSREQESMLSSLVSSKQEQALFELETYKMSRLVPKVRLFKVFDDPDHGEKEIEFIFDRTSNIRTTFMDDDAFDKGTGVGLKNFSFEFNGTNPAEARNDIKANLTLFFQSFQDFTRDRIGYKPEDKYRYVDLVIQPKPDNDGKVGGIEIQSDRQYEPQFYRIRAEVGYVVPTEEEGFTADEINAIRVSNKSFFLNMVDHDISFGKDGTVEIKITYRAYLESLLKHPRLDALASPELIAKRIENARTLTEQLNKRECSVEQIKELQVSLAAQESVLIKQSLSSIITRLRSRGVIYTTLIKKADKDFFLKRGYFNKCEFETGITEDNDGADVKLVLNSNLPESSEDFDFIDSGNRSVQFFYFGDLLYTVLDCVYENEGKIRGGTGFNRNSIILGSFEFEPFQDSSSQNYVYNIADIPISVDFFSRWFVDNVVSQKTTRKTFPLMNFIRSLSNYLIKPSLIENCVNRKLETRLRFQTAQITAFEEGGANPLLESYKLDPSRNPISLDVEALRTAEILPFKGGPVNDADSNFKDFHTFIVLSALGSTLSYAGKGKYEDDIEQGRFHVHVGQNAGLVKTLSLSKSDQQYIREARFFQNGIDGLLQLSAVYVANIEMFGNTLFYPGMEFFFNPYGIGGDNDFDPREAGSIANKLGIGGYHTITSVRSSIVPGKFTTSISAQQYYSGDGSGNPNIVKQKNADRKTGVLESYTPEADDENGFKNCKQVILDTQNYSFEEGTLAGRVGGSSSSSSIETSAPEPIEDSSSAPTTTVAVTPPPTPSAGIPVPPENAEEAFGDADIVSVAQTTLMLEGKFRPATISQYKDGSITTTYLDDDGVEVTLS